MKNILLINFLVLSLFIKAQETNDYVKYTVNQKELLNGNVSYEILFENGIIMKALTELFDTSKHKLMYFEEYSQNNSPKDNRLKFIDGKKFYGSDFLIPKNKLKSLVCSINNVNYNLDVTEMYNVRFFAQENNQRMNLHLKKEGHDWLLIGVFSDAAGMYVVKWIISGKNQYRPIISNEEGDIVNLFFEGKW